MRQLAGQRVIYSYPGPTSPKALLDQIRRGEAAGVIRRLRAVRRRIIELHPTPWGHELALAGERPGKHRSRDRLHRLLLTLAGRPSGRLLPPVSSRRR